MALRLIRQVFYKFNVFGCFESSQLSTSLYRLLEVKIILID